MSDTTMRYRVFDFGNGIQVQAEPAQIPQSQAFAGMMSSSASLSAQEVEALLNAPRVADHSALIRELRDALRTSAFYAVRRNLIPDDKLIGVQTALRKANEALGEKP